MKIEHGFRDWKSHLRLKHTLLAQNVAYVKGLLTVLALLYWFIALCGLHWDLPRFRSRIACWGRPSFFKTALDLLSIADALALATWPRILEWLKDKFRISALSRSSICFAIAATVPGYFFLGNRKRLN